MHWDGSHRGDTKGSQFFSAEKESADFVQFAFSSAGVVARITEDIREGRNTCYAVTVRVTDNRFLMLRNRNEPTVFPEASTDGFKYCFQVPSTFLVFRRNGCVFASGNTGKSMACLWAADYLMTQRQVNRCLIVCPLSIMESAWMKDLMSSIIHRKAAIAHAASMDKRCNIIANGYDFIIINYDGLDGVAETIRKDGSFDLVIADEANFIKNSTTRRWKALNHILTPDTKVWALTGTPAPQSPVDAFGLAKLVTPTNVPKYVTAWKEKTMLKITSFKWIAKGDAPATVHAALQPAIRFTKEMCLDLPPVMTLTRKVEMTKQQEKYYRQMKISAMLSAAGEQVTAVNAATVINKLLQISAGAVYTDESETIEFDCKPRLNALGEILDDTDRKILVFAPYRSSIDTIVSYLQREGITCRAITGDVTPTKRGEIFNDFQSKPDPRVLVIQPQAAAHGVTLTAADTVVFWGPVTSVETYIQCIARADRIGQTGSSVTVHHLYSSEIEAKMFKHLHDRVEDHEAIVKMYTEEVIKRND
jgi:SNF2 family DNA or RNA helicase